MTMEKNMYSRSKLFVPLTAIVTACILTQAAFAHGMSDADKQAIIDGGNLIYMWLGATHMLSGFDHLLFVFGIIFFLKSFRDIAKYVTAFTLGHSVTLIYATFNGIQLNYYLIDAIIALSVCYIAFSNLDGFRKYLNLKSPNMMFMIVGLGLIHGFGLSTRLQELPLSEDSLLLNIISFNVGIELGQLTALAFMLLLIAIWRKKDSFQPFSLVANYGLIIAGALLFLMQVHDYSHDVEGHDEGAVVAADSEGEIANDTISVVVPPKSGIEYKVSAKEGKLLKYVWETDGPELFFDFHGEPKGDKTGYFESYKKGTTAKSEGSVTTPFEGTHGWYWQNNTSAAVNVQLEIEGDYLLLEQK
jgi:HupE / UreJ protein